MAQFPFRMDKGVKHDATTASETKHAFVGLTNGEPPKYVMITTDSADGVECAVGDSTIDASAAPQFATKIGQNPVVLSVLGMTHLSVQNDGAEADVFIGYLGNY